MLQRWSGLFSRSAGDKSWQLSWMKTFCRFVLRFRTPVGLSEGKPRHFLHQRMVSGLDIGLVGPVARGASRFENLLAPQKTYWPPKKLTGPYLKTKLARRKTICINLQFAHRPIIKLFRSHPRNIFQI